MKIKTSELTDTALDWAVSKCLPDLKETVVWGRGAVHDLGYCREYGSGYRAFFVLRSVWDKWMRQCETHAWGSGVRIWSPSTDWSQGGPIIEREHIDIRHTFTEGGYRTAESVDAVHAAINLPNGATVFSPEKAVWEYAPTPLIAAMRCYVASKLGDEVEVPDELA